MAKKPKKNKAFHPPGSLVYRGKPREGLASVRITQYSDTAFEEIPYKGDPAVFKGRDGFITWIHINGIHQESIIAEIGKAFQLHPLLLEDMLTTDTPPKMELFDHALFLSLNALALDDQIGKLLTSNVSLVLTNDVVISSQEIGDDLGKVIYERLAAGTGTIRKRKADYLFYRWMDILVDDYMDVLDTIEDRTEELEDRAINLAQKEFIRELQGLRRQLVRMRRNVSPLRSAVNQLYLERPTELIPEESVHFLRDLLDHLEHIHQRIETVRENLLNIMDINYTTISMRTNEIMQVLTIVATLFIPLTFLAGIYGMNFEYFPELKWKFAYPAFWAVSVAIVLGMLRYFRKRGWM